MTTASLYHHQDYTESDPPRCADHGGLVDPLTRLCSTVKVLSLVERERRSQVQRHGLNLQQLSGTGPEVPWAAVLAGVTGQGARGLELRFREAYEATEGRVSWLQIALEEFAEVAMASASDDPEHLATELVQLAAVCVSWVEKLHDPDALAHIS